MMTTEAGHEPGNNTRIALVGPLPPPVHGLSIVTATMLGMLRERAAVEVFDRGWDSSAQGFVTQLVRIARFFAACCSGARFTLYLALSGGMGQVFDCLYILVSRAFHQRAFIHHHSFAYAHSSTITNRIVFYLVRHQAHIALSNGMASALVKRYGLERSKVMVMSNAAYFDETSLSARSVARIEAQSPVRVGFLSNITFDKGFVEFFTVLERLRGLGVKYQAIIAGPVAPAAKQRFDQLRGCAADVEYQGRIYGHAKDQFYRDLDIFMFPTKYANEADPLVIHEALRAGVYVIACDRGAIAETLDHGAGLTASLDTFVDIAVNCVQALNVDRVLLRERQRLAFEQAQRLRAKGKAALDCALKEIVSASS
jgi:glycosyltransferase involved in cell wall biosynthesis